MTSPIESVLSETPAAVRVRRIGRSAFVDGVGILIATCILMGMVFSTIQLGRDVIRVNGRLYTVTTAFRPMGAPSRMVARVQVFRLDSGEEAAALQKVGEPFEVPCATAGCEHEDRVKWVETAISK